MYITPKSISAGKHTWEPTTLNLREDVNNNVQKLVGEQLQKQFDFHEQPSAVIYSRLQIYNTY